MAVRFLDSRNARRISFFVGCGIFVASLAGDVRAEAPHVRDIAVYDRALASGARPNEKWIRFGDVGLTPERLRELRDRLARGETDFVTPGGTAFKWPGGNVYYRFNPAQVTDGTITAAKMQQFRDSVAEWAGWANLTFIESISGQPNYITVRQDANLGGGGFSTSVGMAGGEQFVDFGPSAWNRGAVCHEVGHALGLWHEQQRTDRDTYVIINLSNITAAAQPNFAIIPGSTNHNGYDFLSVMHYERNALAINPNIDTISMQPGYTQFADVIGRVFYRVLSKLDRKGMAEVYGNPSPLPGAVVTNTKEGGRGSLRNAIYYAFDRSTDPLPTPTTVSFNIPLADPGFSSGVFTIKPTSLLVAPGAGTTIDGATQTTFTGNTNANGPEIVLDGSQIAAQNLGLFAEGLQLREANCAVRNLVINGFNQQGVTIQGATAIGNVVSGCYIGTNSTGTAAVANVVSGIDIVGGASGNTIGGTSAAARNLISGSGFSGIRIVDSTTTGNTIAGNYIGTNAAGTGAVANAFSGIQIYNGAHNNTIGGTGPGARNVISGNKAYGVIVSDPGSSANAIVGNYIGTNAAGMGALSNGFLDPPNHSYAPGVGIYTGAQSTIIGGTTAGAGNVISGNAGGGIVVADPGTNGTLVQGNLIGTNASGTAVIPGGNPETGFNFDGVALFSGTHHNTIGGVTTAARNIISGNANTGLSLGSATNNNLVQGNYIGLDLLGTSTFANGGDGVVIYGGAQTNTVGGLAASAGNVISGNVYNGISVGGAGTNNNLVQGNFIGTDLTGTVAKPNGSDGVALNSGAQSNTIGGTVAAARNVVSGNGNSGVSLGSVNTANNLVQGNFIGTNAAGTAALANASTGIAVFGGAQSNTIGGNTPGAGNVISGNLARGVGFFDAATTNNSIQGNLIGLNAAGTAALANAFSGVECYLASNNTIGGTAPGARNFISGNSDRGVLIDGADATGNKVIGNTIGRTKSGSAAPNGTQGVALFTGAHGNFIGGSLPGESNIISANLQEGVALYDSATIANTISRNSIYSNQSIGIGRYTGSNNNQPAPVLTSATLSSVGNPNGTDVVGSLTGAGTVEFFANPPGGDEGQIFIGTFSAGGGAFATSLVAAVPAGYVISATATAGGSTSQFSNTVSVSAGDLDGDGLPDNWMLAHFGHSDPRANDLSRANDDADGDGLTNLQEFLAGTDPRLATNGLRVTAVTRTPNDFGLTFSSVPGKTYRVEFKDDFVLSNWTLLEDQISATGTSTAITDFGAGILARRAYRVSVEP